MRAELHHIQIPNCKVCGAQAAFNLFNRHLQWLGSYCLEHAIPARQAERARDEAKVGDHEAVLAGRTEPEGV